MLLFVTITVVLEIMVVLWVSPPNHGKGHCDSHGAAVKGIAQLYLLSGKQINNPGELAIFIDVRVKNAEALHMKISEEDLIVPDVTDVRK
jgi:hypothetical protein